jgi:hypothetical protein
MAQGVAVHADSLEAATVQAEQLNADKTEVLVFRDNMPCVTQCDVCCA